MKQTAFPTTDLQALIKEPKTPMMPGKGKRKQLEALCFEVVHCQHNDYGAFAHFHSCDMIECIRMMKAGN
jgi:hypothetical protein